MSDQESYAAGFAAAALASVGTAIPLILQPRSTAEFMLGIHALPSNAEQDRLFGMVAAGLVAAGAASWALKGSAERHELDLNSSETLQLGLIGFAASNLAANIAHMNDLTPNGLAAGVATAAVSMAVPAARLLASGQGRRSLGSRLGSLAQSLGRALDIRRTRGLRLTSALYTVLIPGSIVGGTALVASPAASLEATLGYILKGADSVFLWRQVGGALLTVVPAILLALKEKADNNELNEPQPQILNTGLCLSSLAKLAVLTPMLRDGSGGRYLPAVVGVEALALVAGLSGLACGNATKTI